MLKRILRLINDWKNIDAKPWYLSRTLWINVIAIVALIVQNRYGFILSLEEQMGIITVVNIILRIFTKKELIK